MLQVGPQNLKLLVFDLVDNARRASEASEGAGAGAWGVGGAYGGSPIVAQSLEHLLLLMKGEALPDDGGDMLAGDGREVTGAVAIPTDVPLFVRLGVFQDRNGSQVAKLASRQWCLLN